MRRLAITDSILRWAERCLWVAGSLALGYCGFVLLDARIYQATESRWLDRHLQQETSAPLGTHEQSAPAAAPNITPQQPQTGSLVGRLEIPRLGLSAMVLEGSDERTLQLGVGHLHGTALPGAPGNVVLAAHRDSFFRPLRNIRDGDRITLTTTHGMYEYWVESTAVIDPDDTQVLQASLRPTLTLITCYPFYYVGAAPKRFVVEASEGSGQRPPATAPSATPPLPHTAGRENPQPKHTVAAALRAGQDDIGADKSTLGAADRGEASGAETRAEEDLPGRSRGIRHIPGRVFGRLAGIVRRLE